MNTDIGIQLRCGLFVKADDQMAQILFHDDDTVFHHVIVTGNRIKVIRGGETIFDMQVEGAEAS